MKSPLEESLLTPDSNTNLGPDEHAAVVKKGYDKIATAYNEKRGIFDNMKEIEEFLSLVPDNGTVLDVGCGGGVPVLKMVIERGFSATGIDFSKGMLEIAEKNVPEAELVHGDVTKKDFPNESFDGIISTYAIIHIHRSLHPALYSKVYRWLKPGGVLLISTASDETAMDYAAEDYFGEKMVWSHPGANDVLQIMRDVGFKIVFHRTVTSGDETHLWILAKKA